MGRKSEVASSKICERQKNNLTDGANIPVAKLDDKFAKKCELRQLGHPYIGAPYFCQIFSKVTLN